MRAQVRDLVVLAFCCLLAFGLGCNSDSSGSACTSNASCAVGSGEICCVGTCAPAAICGACTTPEADVADDWAWRFVCMDTLGNCPVRDDTHTITMTQPVPGTVHATVTGSDDIRATLCSEHIFWLETGTGTDNGCWTLDAGATQFNQRSTADGGQRLCLGVAARTGTALPTVPSCTDLQNLFNAQGAAGFQTCPPAPPAAPGGP